MPANKLPLNDHDLARRYLAGETFRQIADDVGCSWATVRNRVRDWAKAHDKPWPLRVYRHGIGPHVHDVDAQLYVSDIARAVTEYRITQTALAKLGGLNPSHLYKITSGFIPRISPRTAQRIDKALEIAAKKKHTPMPAVGLKHRGRTHCANGHEYRGHRHPDGTRMCRMCRADQERKKAS